MDLTLMNVTILMNLTHLIPEQRSNPLTREHQHHDPTNPPHNYNKLTYSNKDREADCTHTPPVQLTFSYKKAPTIHKLLRDMGFGFIDYKVTTDDDYVLSLTRITRNPSEANNAGYPVLLVNGFLFKSEGWLALGNASLPIILANNGYDVWLGDQRGSDRSMKCLKYSWSDPRAQDYSFHEQGIYDLPAFIDKILQNSAEKKVLYVGYSLSAGMFIAMNSERPSYGSKVKAAVFLAPAAHLLPWKANRPGIYRVFLTGVKLMILYSQSEGIYEFPGNKKFVHNFIRRFVTACNQPFWKEMCGSWMSKLYGNSKSIDVVVLPTGYDSHTSFFKDSTSPPPGRFSHYDYGSQGNGMKYGMETPPDYNFRNTRVPVFIFYGGSDMMVSKKSAKETCDDIHNCLKMKFIPQFNHADFVFGKTAPELIYEHIAEFFNAQKSVGDPEYNFIVSSKQ